MSNGAVLDFYTSNTEIDYPFDSRPSDGSYRLFVDAYVVHNRVSLAGQRLQLVRFDPAGICDLKFEDGTVLDNLTALDGFQNTVFGQYTIYRWQKSTTVGVGFTDEDLAVQVVVLTSQLANFTFPLDPPLAFLQASLVTPHPGRVRRIALALQDQSCCVGFAGEQVALVGGNNTDLSLVTTPALPSLGILTPSVTRQPTTIKIDMTPGGGTGKFIDCDSTTPSIKTINQATPNAAGDFDLSGEDCTWVERRVTDSQPPINPNTNYSATPVEALLQLHQNCLACCDCIDYGLAYETIAKLWERAKTASKQIEDARKRYNELDTLVNQIKSTTETGLKIKVQLVARPDYHLAIQMTAYLDSKQDINETISIVAAIDTFGFTLTPGSGILDIADAHKRQLDPARVGANGLYWFIPGLKSTGYAQASCEIRFPRNITNQFAVPVSRIGRIITVFGTATYGVTLANNVANIKLVGPLVKT